ncbi:phosphotransferase [Clostridium pasteurianum]|uniref:Phosphotransferase family protein n=1 Tax=Clostridium pasteurianum BC1 TaxID=86416 RepID=R4K1P7_CLOPA|nr:phosphotransferase [Clostridium pasteurianum]AGK95706.1 phosphotransferase family protein [Clostridium pasteurianum BC1]
MERIINALYKAYGLQITKVKNIEYGLWEESFEVWTLTEKFFAKRFWKKDRIETRHDEMLRGLLLSQELRANGFPVPELIFTKNKMPLAHIDGETYEVTEWVEGNTFHPGELPKEGAYSMGCLLGKFHSFFQVDKQYKYLELPSPLAAIQKCKKLLCQYEHFSGKFADNAKQVLSEQIEILELLPRDFLQGMITMSRVGLTFNSFWVEQIIFNDKFEVNALIDWTDGAGRIGCWAGDIDTALHISAFDKDAIVQFCRGYQNFNYLTKEEWESVFNLTCYKHLCDTWIFDSWVKKYNRRMEHWENITIKWSIQVPIRFYQWREIKELVLQFAN